MIIDGQGVRIEDPPELVGGISAIVITLAYKTTHDQRWALRQIVDRLDFVAFYSDRLRLVRTVDDIMRAKLDGTVGLVLNFEQSTPVGLDLSIVRVYYELGIRSMQLTYDERTAAGSGCMEPEDLGLTSFGRQLIRTMERCGMLVDLSHAGRQTSMDALRHARRPVVFGHANPAGLFDSPRNVTDDVIRACAALGGLVGITPTSAYYCPHDAPRPQLSDMVKHISYVADLVGIDHVAVAYEAPPEASAFQTAMRAGRPSGNRPAHERRVAGAESRKELPLLTAELLRNGFSEEDALKVLGANWVRVFREVWRS